MGTSWFGKKKVREHVPDKDLAPAKARAEHIIDRGERVSRSLADRKGRNGFTALAATIFRGN